MIRTSCIFCNSKILKEYFEKDYIIPIGCYNINNCENKIKTIPFNILICDICKTIETKYLGDLDDIYNINHADACGEIKSVMHDKFSELILKTIKYIKGFIEIGAGNGELSKEILLKIEGVKYNIIDPYYFGIKENRNIINKYIEDINLSEIDGNIIIMSHVFEHFYEPLKIIETIDKSKNIEYICLCFPDLEGYIKNNTYNLLSIEHTYYIENKFLKDIFLKNGFETICEEKYKEHSIFLILKRTHIKDKNIICKNENTINDINLYYNNIKHKINKLNNILELVYNNIDIYIFPCSIHTQYLFILGLNLKYFKSILDNSKEKINKYLYGYNIKCESLDNFININKKSIIIMNGGCFNKEININLSSNIIYIY